MNEKMKNKTRQDDLKLKIQGEELKKIQKENLDFLGKKYFLKANKNILQHNFKTAYKYMMLGYRSVVCDCGLGNWILKDLKTSLINCKTFNCNISQLNLIQAYIHWISREYESALNFVNSFINYVKDEEVGFYLKGRIYEGMKEFEKAVENYKLSLSIKRTNKTLHRIGRIKEAHLNENGIAELYEASLSNVISHCAGRLAENSAKRGIFLPGKNSFFVDSFNDGGALLFAYDFLNQPTIKLKNGMELNFLKEKSKLLKSLIKNKHLFFEKEKH